MKKEFTFTIDVSDGMVGSDDVGTPACFGLTEERASFLAFEQLNRYRTKYHDGDEVNDVAEFLNFVAQEPLSGNDIAFLTFCGWKTMLTVQRARRHPIFEID